MASAAYLDCGGALRARQVRLRYRGWNTGCHDTASKPPKGKVEPLVWTKTMVLPRPAQHAVPIACTMGVPPHGALRRGRRSEPRKPSATNATPPKPRWRRTQSNTSAQGSSNARRPPCNITQDRGLHVNKSHIIHLERPSTTYAECKYRKRTEGTCLPAEVKATINPAWLDPRMSNAHPGRARLCEATIRDELKGPPLTVSATDASGHNSVCAKEARRTHELRGKRGGRAGAAWPLPLSQLGPS